MSFGTWDCSFSALWLVCCKISERNVVFTVVDHESIQWLFIQSIIIIVLRRKWKFFFFQQTTIKMTWQGMKKSAAQCIQSYQLSCILIKLSFRPRATGKSNRLILHFLEGDSFKQIVISLQCFFYEIDESHISKLMVHKKM